MTDFKQFEEYMLTQKWREFDEWVGTEESILSITNEFCVELFSGMITKWFESKNIFIAVIPALGVADTRPNFRGHVAHYNCGGMKVVCPTIYKPTRKQLQSVLFGAAFHYVMTHDL